MTHFPFKDVQIVCHIQYLTFLLPLSTGHDLIIQSNAYSNDNNVKQNSAEEKGPLRMGDIKCMQY